ncbi:MAG: SurA N-terminal domain-containing protein, partial [Nitrospinota bacterium]
MKRKSIFLIWLLMIQSSITNQCTSEDSGKKEHLASQAAGGGKRFVLIEVNGEPIYKDELSKKLETFQKRLSPLVSEKKKVDPGILLSSVSKNLVQDKLILQEATRQNVFVIESEVEAAVKKNTVGYTPELLRSLLREKGVTQREWREEISKRLLREKISRQVIEKSLTVT